MRNVLGFALICINGLSETELRFLLQLACFFFRGDCPVMRQARIIDIISCFAGAIRRFSSHAVVLHDKVRCGLLQRSEADQADLLCVP